MTDRHQYYRLLPDHSYVPCTLEEWAAEFEGRRTHVGWLGLPGGYVSTVWLGTDHAWDGPPLLFETLINGGEHDQWQVRYTTWAEAEAGHAVAVALATGTGNFKSFTRSLMERRNAQDAE